MSSPNDPTQTGTQGILLRKTLACALAALQIVPLGLLASAATGAHAQQSLPAEFGYDPNGNLRYAIDPNGRTVDNTIDNLNRVKKQTLPAPVAGASRPELSYTYDGQDRITSITDARGNTTTYTRSGLGDTVQNSPDTGTTVIHFDEAGQLGDLKNALGKGVAPTYDALGRIEYAYDQSGWSRFVYDTFSTTPGSENYGRGRLTAILEYALPGISAPKSRVTFAYDPQGRVTRKCQILGASSTCTAADTLTYRWGPATGADAGRLLGLTYPSGRLVDYQYDALSRITGITTTAPGSSSAQTVLRDAQYTPLAPEQGGHGLTGLAFGPSGAVPAQTYQRAYDNSGRLTMFSLGKGSYANAASGLHTIDYDDAGRILGVNRLIGSWASATYTYDELDRLTAMALNGVGQYGYSYDANGNRTRRTAGSSTTNLAYPATSNRLASTQAGSGASQAVTTDATGNITQDPNTAVGVVNFTYNQRTNLPYGRLARTQGAGGEYSYLYNALGQRISKTGTSYTPAGGPAIAPAAYIGSTDMLFHYDLDGKLIAELDPATKQVKREIIWLGEQPVALIAGATPTQMVSGTNAPALYYVHADHLNTPRMVTDTAGGRRWDWGLVNNEPFGATAPNEAPQGQAAAQQFAFNLRFPGQYLDKETGTSYNYYRSYNPVTGRYLQSDPIGLNGGINTYGYANGNPLRFSDPYGLWGMDDVYGAVYDWTGGWEPSQGLVDFSAGWGDMLSFGITSQVRGGFGIGSVNKCSAFYKGGEAFGFVNGLALGWAQGTKAAAKAASGNNWANFSHSLFPKRFLKQFDNQAATWMNKVGNRMNGDFVTPALHTRMDAAAQFGLSREWLAANPLFSPFRQLINRVPYVPGAAAYGAGSAAMNSCNCEN